MTLAAIACNISMATAELDIDLDTVHIHGKLNIIADVLSRLSINPNLVNKLHQIIPNHGWVNPGHDALTLDWCV